MKFKKTLIEIKKDLRELDKSRDLAADCKYLLPIELLIDELKPYLTDKIPTKINQSNLIEYMYNNFSFIVGDNTYNYNGYLSHDINWETFKDDYKYYTVIMFHRYGDIRANYTDYIVCEFDFEDQFYELLYNLTYQVGFEFEYNNKHYMVSPQILSEYLDVYCEETQENVEGICAIDDGELREALEAIKED